MQQRPATTRLSASLFSRREKVSLVIGIPLIVAMLVVEVARIRRAVIGEPLLITGLFGSDISVQWSVNALAFVLGVAFHLIILAFLLGVLWVQFDMVKRWLRLRRTQV